MPETPCVPTGYAVVIIYVACPDAACAERIARAVLGERLVACANILPGMRSIYRWDGVLESADEVLLLLKTSAAGSAVAVARIAALHPYTVPGVVVLPLCGGTAPFAAWVAGEVAGG